MKYEPQHIAQALRDAEGNISEAARQIGASRTTVRKYIHEFPEVKEIYEEVNDTTGDIVESEFIKVAKNPSHPDWYKCARYYLATKLKHRGWRENIEVAGDDKAPFTVIIKDAGDDE